jgi:general stress protein 26
MIDSRRSTRVFCATLWLAGLGAWPLPASGQAAPARLDSVARRIVAAARYATFVTVDAEGRPQARTVQPRAPLSGWSIWFATNPRTRKVKEISGNARVAMHYFDPGTDSYVAVTGRARVVRDRATKDAMWDPAWNSFYPDRETGVVLIAVEAERVEVVAPTLGVDSDPATWRPQSFTPAPVTRKRP